MNKWISIKDKKPEDGQRIIAKVEIYRYGVMPEEFCEWEWKEGPRIGSLVPTYWVSSCSGKRQTTVYYDNIPNFCPDCGKQIKIKGGK